jgi:phosphatidylserine/phosphatidylglycerophosphate/cardiolipin synthase-like enzyme
MRAFLYRWLLRLLLAALLLAWAAIALWQSHKRLPPGIDIAGSWHSVPVSDVRFLSDLTAADAGGARLHERQINAELLRMIAQARDFLVLDTGLFGDLPAAGAGASRMRAAAPVAAALTDALLQARRLQPGLQVLLLIDPTSTQLNVGTAALQRLRAAGVAVVPVDVSRLRAPNAAFASLWQLCCSWWTADAAVGDWPNPLGVGANGVSFGLWGGTPGYQRSHRQLLIGDNGAGRLTGIIFSRPLNAEASLHTAVALQLSGGSLEPLLESEFVVAQFSGWSGGDMQERAQRLFELRHHGAASGIATASSAAASTDAAHVRVLSEASIADALLQRINTAGSHDSIEIAALYLSQRDLVRALIDAAWRGAGVRVLLDPGKDGYGYERSGLPNRQVASELVSASDGAVRVRWYRTHGEQFSPGFALIRGAGRAWLLVGTAELSRRDLDDFNLAAAFNAELPGTAATSNDALSWFDTLWYNRAAGGTEYSSDADVYADASQLDYWQYRLLEASGASFD